jgi:hypothetical protein
MVAEADQDGRAALRAQIERLHKEVGRYVVENNAKGAVVALQEMQAMLLALFCDELEATQQVFDRFEVTVQRLEGRIARLAPEPPNPSPTPPAGSAELDSFLAAMGYLDQMRKGTIRVGTLAATGADLVHKALEELLGLLREGS